jgi:hypothetical protein
VVPIFFKPQIVRMIKDKANQNINATLNFKDVSIGLISAFPNAKVSVENITVVNKAPFEGDTLASLKSFEITINPWRFIFSHQLEILSLSIDKPDLFLVTLKDGRSNYMILPQAQANVPVQPGAATPMNLAIRNYSITDGRIVYANDSSGIFAEVIGLNHSGNGDFAKSIFTLSTKTKIDALSFQMGGISYLNKAELDVKADLDMDMTAKKYTFKENEIKLNQLALNFNGWVQMAGEDINMDLTFKTPTTEFKSLLSMIPAVYSKDFSDLKAQGQFSFEGKAQGTYNKKQVPLIDARLLVDNGMFEYSQLKTSAKNVALDLQIQNPGRTIDDTEIDLRKFHVEILNEPVDAQLLVKTPISNLYVDGFLKGNINLADVRKLIPMSDSVQLAGMVHSDFTFRGNTASLQQKQMGNFTASGLVAFSNINYGSPLLPAPIQVSTANLIFSPSQAKLENFNMQMGKSDLKANGSLDNVFGYVFGKQVLTGNLAINSNYLDLTPFMKQQSGAIQAVELPARAEFQMAGNFNEILLDNMDMTNVKGKLLLKDQILTLTDLSANFLGGTMVSNGTYSYIKPAKPHINFDLKLSQLGIPEMYKTFVTVQTFAPMAGYLKGQINGTVNLSSDLGDSLMPLWQTLISQGALQIPQAQIENFAPLNKIADVLGIAAFHDPAISNLAPGYNIKDGFFHLKPINFNIGNIPVIATGSNGLDKSLDYQLNLQLPASMIKNNLNSALSSIVGSNTNLMGDETVTVNVGVSGLINDPKISTSLGQIAKGLGKQLQEKAKQELEQQVQQKLNQQQSTVEDSVKKVIEAQKQKQTEDIKNKIKGLFGK